MNNIYLFAISLGIGFICSFSILRIIIQKKKKDKAKKHEELKDEVIKGLQKLK
ncbi:preprotein translocase subunit YajC [Methanococcus maripaludis]|uniref:Preprotein translocase subunit YajC n=2 Tax=Methanococcus maripaludis TaxID=39152 RepID=A0A7J9RZQ4_METMI|nr:hypothetical protein [Methanococcus maripaludis]AEK20022.1 hypothetical protein GYY_05785 [Methanococcus maripaludis X1]MBA2846879.1 preprotein translocase subunit YajC [Methanococcus maripaludis]MBA2858042.1 preprotein translocase subunit YajC [Methanococcus maripaludis]MBB6066737.1 preprotein translocase subunit YajC [Methanococcus maripaludis]